MSDTITEIRALLMQFEKSGLKDLYVRSKDWTVFMAQPDGAANPMQAAQAADGPVNLSAISAPHLGLFEPVCAAGDEVTSGEVIAIIDVLGRKTEIASTSAGRVASVLFAANDLVEFGEVVVEIAAS